MAVLNSFIEVAERLEGESSCKVLTWTFSKFNCGFITSGLFLKYDCVLLSDLMQMFDWSVSFLQTLRWTTCRWAQSTVESGPTSVLLSQAQHPRPRLNQSQPSPASGSFTPRCRRGTTEACWVVRRCIASSCCEFSNSHKKESQLELNDMKLHYYFHQIKQIWIIFPLLLRFGLFGFSNVSLENTQL